MTTPLPKITYDAPETVASLDLANIKLDAIREVIDTMSVRLNIKLGSMASMMSDFFDLQRKGIDNNQSRPSNELYGINVKLGSLNMMIGEFFEEQRRRWASEGLRENNDDQVKPPKPPKPDKPDQRDKLDYDDIRDKTQSFLGKVLTGLGLAFLAADLSFGDAIRESGIIVYLTKGLMRIVMVGSGIAKLFSGIGNLPVLKQIGTMTRSIIAAIDWVGLKIIPAWRPLTRMIGSVGKLIPFAAMVTTILDFIRGWTQTEGDWVEKVKGGIAEVMVGWIGWPLEILKNIVSWAMNKIGLDTSWIDSLDFVSIVRDFGKGLLDFLHGVLTLDPSKFPEGLVDFGSMVAGLLNDTINSVVNWVRNAFNIGDVEVPFNFGEWLLMMTDNITKFVKNMFAIDWNAILEIAKVKITETVTGFVDDIKNYFKGLFSDIKNSLPTWDDFKKAILPTSWYTSEKDDSSLNQTIADIDKKIADNKEWVKRSMGGENVFNGFESLGISRALATIEESNRMRAELIKEKNARERANAAKAGGNINIVRGGSNTVNNSTTQVNQFSSMPTSNRPDKGGGW